MRKNRKNYKEIELINIKYNPTRCNSQMCKSIDVIIDNLLDDIYFYKSHYDFIIRILTNLYNEYDNIVEINKANPTLLLCENIIAIEHKISLYEKSFIKTVGKLSKAKMDFELITFDFD